MSSFSIQEKDIPSLLEIIREAGSLAHRMQKEGLHARRKADSSIVTEADEAVQDFLLKKFGASFDGLSFIHEENFDRHSAVLAEDRTTVIIDPIDGTAMFSMQLPLWCVSVGVFHGYRPVYGFVYSPGADMLFYNDDTSAYCNGRRIKSEPLCAGDSEANLFYASEVPRIFDLHFTGKVRNLGSTALHACLIADNGRNRSIGFIGSSFLWDWAGALPVLEKAGAHVRYLNGDQLDIKEIASKGYRLKEYALAYSCADFQKVQAIFHPRSHSDLSF